MSEDPLPPSSVSLPRLPPQQVVAAESDRVLLRWFRSDVVVTVSDDVARHVGDTDGDRLAVGERAVGNLHRDVVDIVRADIAWRLEIGSIDEAQCSGGRIDRELGRISTARDGVGQRCPGVRVVCRHRRHRCGVFCDQDCGRCTTAIRRDRGAWLVAVATV